MRFAVRIQMKINVLFFASCREAIGMKELALDLDSGVTIAGIRKKIISQFPQLAGVSKALHFARNSEYVAEDTPLHDGDEIAILPPVSGG